MGRPRMPSQDEVLRVANNAWLLLISRTIALVAVPLLIYVIGWSLSVEVRLRQTETTLAVRDTEIEELQEDAAAARARAFTREDARRMENRLTEQLNQLREDLRIERSRNRDGGR